jgi:hypothetical protein
MPKKVPRDGGPATAPPPIDRPQDALNQRIEFRQGLAFFRQIAMPIIDALDALDHMRHDALANVRPHAHTLHERLGRAAPM